MPQHKIARVGLAAFGFAVATVSLALLAAPASAQSISKQGFNFNVPGCPGKATATIGTDKFSDGSALPSCGGRETNGTIITTYKLVWTGRAWAKYPPSVQQTNTATQAPKPSAPSGLTLSSSVVSNLPSGSLNGQTVVLYQGNWDAIIAAGAGNFTATLISQDGGGLVGPSGGTYSLQSVGGTGMVRTSKGNVVMNAANVARYKAAKGIR